MRKLISLFTLILITSVTVGAQNITFKGSAPGAVVANERFQVNYTIQTAGETARDIRVPDVDGLNQLYGPVNTGTSMSSYSSGGQTVVQMSTTYTYTYLAPATGSFTIPPASIKVGNSNYKSNEIKIDVVASSNAIPKNNPQQNNNQGSGSSNQASVGQDEIFMRMHVSKRNVYENEGFLVTFKLYSRYSNVGFSNMQFPNFEGFITHEIEQAASKEWNLEAHNNTQYYTAILKQYIVFPIKSGKVSIESGKYEVEIAKRVATNSISFFDPIFTTQTVKRNLTTAATAIDVEPLPAGKPASFTGAVGDYSMKTTVTPEELKTDEVVTVKVSLSGSGNIKFLKNPVVTFPNDFDRLDPKVSESAKTTTAGVTGSKSIEYYGLPRYPGTYTIPNVEFSYFDPKSKTYKTLSSGSHTIKVEQGEGGATTGTTIVSGTNKEDVKYLGQDIRHIKTGNVSFHKGSYFWGSIGYWLWFILPAVLFIAFFIVNRKQAKQNANLALTRTKKANKVAAKRLKLANKYLKEDNKDAFYEEISKAVWGYLGDKLNMPAASLTKDNVESELNGKQVDETLIKDFINILNTAEFARFAPSGGHEAMDELYRSAVKTIDKMEGTIKK
ncbi:BatD family protein [Bacteroidales bacterium OttesenSCG-928-L03]|nr:BatD family protein [Bacteroidales bacterium OttesenSCG-928-L03]